MARCRDGQETGFPVPGTFSGIEMNDLTNHFETAKFILKRLGDGPVLPGIFRGYASKPWPERSPDGARRRPASWRRERATYHRERYPPDDLGLEKELGPKGELALTVPFLSGDRAKGCRDGVGVRGRELDVVGGVIGLEAELGGDPFVYLKVLEH